jgi:hypothetical protein
MQFIIRHTVLETSLLRRSQTMQKLLRVGIPQGIFVPTPSLRGKMKRTLISSTLLLIASLSLMTRMAVADINNCQNLYIGQIVVEKGFGSLSHVMFKDNPDHATGSKWVVFRSWSEDEKKSALALLTAAKVAQHRVNIITQAADGCSIVTLQALEAQNVGLAINP